LTDKKLLALLQEGVTAWNPRWHDVSQNSLDLKGANLSNAYLSSANLRGADLSDADLGFAYWNTPT
jgi:uncharacterized protein YjbI with pentapeptide repeats